MSEGLSIVFFNVVMPVFIIIAAGFFLQRWRPSGTNVFSTLLMYVLTPALMFSTIMHSQLTADDLQTMTWFALVFIAVSWLAGAIGVKALKLNNATRAAVLLCVILQNGANYGASASLFAWGQEAFQTALIFMVIHQAIASVITIFISARGKQTIPESLAAPFKQPVVYVSIFAAVFRAVGWEASHVPVTFMAPVDMLAEASIPLALVMLGMYLSDLKFDASDWTALGLVNVARLIAVPLLMIPVTTWLSAEGLLRNVLILQAAMPTAVTSLVYAAEFDARPDFVGAAVVATTVVSLVTVTVTLQLLGV